jgi:hypothetical protein
MSEYAYLHDRMVVILKKEMLQLNLKSDDVDDIAVLLTPTVSPNHLVCFCPIWSLFRAGHCNHTTYEYSTIYCSHYHKCFYMSDIQVPEMPSYDKTKMKGPS